MTGPTGWRGKFLAVGLLIAVALAVYGLVVEPVAITFVAHRDSIADSKQLLARYRALDVSRADLAADIAEMKQRSSREGDYFEGATETLAARRSKRSWAPCFNAMARLNEACRRCRPRPRAGSCGSMFEPSSLPKATDFIVCCTRSKPEPR